MLNFTLRRSNGVGIRLNPEKLAKRIATFCDANNINDDAALEVFINNLTTVPQVRAVVRELIVALTDFVPPAT